MYFSRLFSAKQGLGRFPPSKPSENQLEDIDKMPKEKDRPSKDLEGPAGAARQRSLSKSKPKEASRTTAEKASVRRGSVVRSSRRASSAAGQATSPRLTRSQTSRAISQAIAPTPGPMRGATSKPGPSSSSTQGATSGASSSRGPGPTSSSAQAAIPGASSSRRPGPSSSSAQAATPGASSSRRPGPSSIFTGGAILGPSSSRRPGPSTSSARGATPGPSSSRGPGPSSSSARGAIPGVSSSRGPGTTSSTARGALPGPSSSQVSTPRPNRPIIAWLPRDPILAQFKHHQLVTYGALEHPDAVYPPMMETPLHPIFNRHLFGSISDGYWSLIQPALKLATKLITNSAAMPFWHAILCGPLMRLPDDPLPHPPPSSLFSRLPASEKNPTRAKGDAAGALTGEQVVATLSTLGLYRDMIEWRFCELPGWICGQSQRSMKAHPLGGNGCNVKLNFRYLAALEPSDIHTYTDHSGVTLPPTRYGPRTPSRMLRISFALAITLCHELAHAIWMGRSGPLFPYGAGTPPHSHPLQPSPLPPCEYEPYFEDDKLTELGYAWEQTAFGGRIYSFSNDFSCQFGIYFERWPPGADASLEWGAALASICRGPPDRAHTTHWLVPMTHVRALFTNSFWEEDLMRHGSNGLKYPRTLGIQGNVQVTYNH
ncbi:MAG: hypothetical protein M4579_007463 [Chaenotheca gracillima]|nr:MAG: hypothetical protein M4579_007463 [Chaenotheca gracillima]